MRMRSLLIGLAVLAILLVVVGWFDRSAPAGAGAIRDSPTPERLSVAVDNGHTRAREGDVLTYTTRVRNDDPRAHRLQVTQMLPAALRVTSTTGSGQANAREVSWDVTLAPGEERVLRAVTEVGPSREGYGKLATTSCVGVPGQPPFTCDEDTDPLTVTSTAAPSIGRLMLTSGLALILVLGAVAVYAVGSENPAPRGSIGQGVPGRVGAGGPDRAATSAGRRIRSRRKRRARARKGAAVPARVADPLRAWIARVSGMIAARCRAPWPAPSWYVPVRHGKARSPPSVERTLAVHPLMHST